MKILFLIMISIIFISCNDSTNNQEDLQCKNNSCSRNEICSVNNNKIECSCKDGYINENDSCINQKEVDCKENSQLPENSEEIKRKVTITYNNNSWSEPENCKWRCKDNFFKEESSCINQKQVSCKDVTPLNGIKIDKEVTITYSDNSWSEPEDCEWSCKDGYELTNNSCIESNDFPIVIYGDTRNHTQCALGQCYEITSKHEEVLVKITTENPKYIFNSGDLVEDGNEESQWDDFFDIVAPLVDLNTYFPVLGNHEHDSHFYYDNFELPGNEQWYLKDIGPIRFIAINSNESLLDGDTYSEQYNWIESKLQNLPENIKFVIPIFHHPMFSSGHHGGDTDLRAILHPLFKRYNVDVVFNGHDHSYERLVADNITYIVTGGGGAILDPTRLSYDDRDYSKKFASEYHYCVLNIVDGKLKILVKDIDGNEIETVIIDSHR